MNRSYVFDNGNDDLLSCCRFAQTDWLRSTEWKRRASLFYGFKSQCFFLSWAPKLFHKKKVINSLWQSFGSEKSGSDADSWTVVDDSSLVNEAGDVPRPLKSQEVIPRNRSKTRKMKRVLASRWGFNDSARRMWCRWVIWCFAGILHLSTIAPPTNHYHKVRIWFYSSLLFCEFEIQLCCRQKCPF